MNTEFVIHDDSVPLRKDIDGLVRVGSSGVLLQTVVDAYLRGANPEYIARGMYTTLDVADVYSVIGYYLRHKEEVDEYLRRLEAAADAMRQQVQARQGPPRLTREILEQRLSEQEAAGVAPVH